MKIALTGGIACGKSLLSQYLRESGVEIIDADDIVHSIVPAEERRRLAKTVFADPEARKALEGRVHPLVHAKIGEFWARKPPDVLGIAVIPLLFEVHWDGEYDIICTVTSPKEAQVSRMMESRGYSREEAEARIAAQMPVGEKAARSHYTIENNGSAAKLRDSAKRFVEWIRSR